MASDMSTAGVPRREDGGQGVKRGPLSLRAGLLLAVVGCALGLFLGVQLLWHPDTAPSYAYYRETRYSVRGPFYAFYREHGGPRIFGYPITEAVTDDDGRRVQYFQRARMELHADGRIYLGNLCDELGYGKPAPPAGLLPPDGPYTRTFSSGHSSAYAFLSFYEQNGGDTVFGNPITEPELVNGRISQTWQRARMEWWPENPTGQRVVLLDVGSVYASGRVPGEWLAPVADSADAAPAATPVTTELYVMAMRAVATLRPGAAQTVQVMVLDQTGRAIKGARVRMTEVSRSGQWELPASVTDGTGTLMLSYEPAESMPGEIVTIEVAVTYAGLTRLVQTSYLVE